MDTIKKQLNSYNKTMALSIFISLTMFLQLMTFISYAKGDSLTIYTEESEPFHFTDKDGKIKGCVYELILEMQKKMGDTTPIQMVPWARGYHFATTEANTAIFSTTFTEERRPLFKWVGPISESVWVLYARARSGIRLNYLDDAKSLKSIGTYKDDAREQFLIEKGFKNLDSVRDDKLNLKKLLSNRIDLWASSIDRANSIAKDLDIPINSIEPVLKMVEKGLFIAFNKDTPDDVVDAWEKAYNQVYTDGTMDAIYKKWNVSIPKYKIPVIEEIED